MKASQYNKVMTGRNKIIRLGNNSYSPEDAVNTKFLISSGSCRFAPPSYAKCLNKLFLTSEA
jgi:hypothetical protein